jgi:hypothetical protein
LFLGWHGREKFGCFSKQKGGILFFFEDSFGGVWRKQMGILFFFCDMMI